jgi:hypothetical protein
MTLIQPASVRRHGNLRMYARASFLIRTSTLRSNGAVDADRHRDCASDRSLIVPSSRCSPLCADIAPPGTELHPAGIPGSIPQFPDPQPRARSLVPAASCRPANLRSSGRFRASRKSIEGSLAQPPRRNLEPRCELVCAEERSMFKGDARLRRATESRRGASSGQSPSGLVIVAVLALSSFAASTAAQDRARRLRSSETAPA